jgi:hypothetical protein
MVKKALILLFISWFLPSCQNHSSETESNSISDTLEVKADSSLVQEAVEAPKPKPAKNVFHTDAENVFVWADSIALSLDIPPKLVFEIGMNESRWPNPEDLDYLIRQGDLQVIDASFNKMYRKLKLTGGRTRYNYLVVGVHYLKDCYIDGGTWQRARYIYGRGRWKDSSEWTNLEKHFMNKIDWSQYDK